MSAPGRPKGEFRSAQHEGNLMSAPGRPKGEFRSAQHEGTLMSPPPPPSPGGARERLAALPPDKRSALELLLRRQGRTLSEPAAPGPQLVAGPRPAELPLSFDQQRVWFLHQLDPQGSAFNLQLRTIVDAPPEVLAQAVEALVDRHEVLRTTYNMGARGPHQRVQAPAWQALTVIDLREVPDEGLTAAALPRLGAERGQPFDLTLGVWRALLFRLSRGRSALCMTIHHIATDGWSIDRLIAELREMCAAGQTGREPRLPELPIQYADYAVWQRAWLQGSVLAEQLGWWREQLAGMPMVLDLHTDLPRPPVASGRGAAIAMALPAPLAEGLRAMAQHHQATMFMTLLALFKCLLARHTGQTDVVVGTPVAGRNRPELANVQGLFLNSLVLRTEVGGDIGFNAVLARVRDTVSGAFNHPELPFEKLVTALQPQRDLSRNPLFQALFTQPILDRYVTGVTRQAQGDDPVDLPQGQGEFDIGLWFEDYGGAATLTWHYAADLFLPATVQRLARQFLVLARAVVADPAVLPCQVDLLEAAEHDQLRACWQAVQAALPTEPLTRAIEAQARRRPDAPALRFDGHALAYAELNRRANRLARHLRAVGAGADVMVAVHLERGIDMVVAVLAVLKAGAAYVPMDPRYPVARLAAMLDDSGAALRLTQASLRDALPVDAARPVLVDAEAADIAARSGENLPETPGMHDLAYVIYTSGSTGRPKGVMIEHLALANFIAAMARQPGCAEDDVVVALTTLSFDIAGLELYLPLATGACIALASAATAVDGAALARLIDDTQATMVQATPASWRLLLAAGWTGHPRLKLLCGGEALPRELAERLLPCGAGLWNLYGPTETTIWSAAARVLRGPGPVLLGGPIANTRLHVLDRHRLVVPAGAVGELAIGGAGVARGYWRRPELTAERFVPDPFATEPGARLYLTGDAVRRLADGGLEFIGRNDGQIKLRGFRIELGEVQAVLERVPGVAQAVALLREDRPGEARLVAYVVSAPDATLQPAELQGAAARELPAHMVPTAWVLLAALPLTPNGKVDRLALTAPATSATAAVARETAPPMAGLEQRLAAIWQQVLGIERVRRRDNFFDLGGDSLGFVMVQSALREALGIELPVVELFAHPTLESLARRLADQAPPSAGPGPQRGRQLGELRRARHAGHAAGLAGASTDGDIAVVAMHGRFPGARNLAEFWAMLCGAREGLRFFTDDELIAAGHDAQLVRHPDYVKSKGVAPEVDLFDAGFFGYSPSDAAALDPQQRLFLEHAWSALEAAGIDAQRHPGAIGVYASTSLNSYSLHEALSGGDAGRMFLNDKDYLATRVAYKLDLHGPSLTVQTACSSSLVAVVEACESLVARRCDVALAGGVSVSVPLASGHLWQDGGVASRDGHCRAFDAAASGCVAGNGVGVVVLMRLADAREGGHPVLAVVKGVAVNNDGAAKAGFTAPSVAGQAEVISTAQALAGVAPATVGYVETHGTGTVLGDPIELAALTQAFRAGGDTRRQACAIGSLKTNIGHLDAAAGVAGFIKAVLCVSHGQLPPSLNFDQPNPKIGFGDSPFHVQTVLADWPVPEGHPRRAGVSSFGIGGTNAHVVLEQAPPDAPAPATGCPQLLLLSARSASALDTASTQLADFLDAEPGVDLCAAAATLQLGRRAFEHRRMLVAGSVAEAVQQLRDGRAASALTPPQAVGTAFLFSGQGTQHLDMARGLLERYAGFRADVEDAARRLRGPMGLDLMDLLAPTDAGGAAVATELLSQTRYAQPALFVVEWALARLWRQLGVEPDAMLGHSLGEWVAACLAEVFTLDDTLALVALRGQLMQAQPSGAMLAVPLSAGRAQAQLAGGLSLAADNADGLCVVAGPHDEIDALQARWAADGIAGTRLHTSHAFHSAAMDAVVPAFTSAVAAVPRRAPKLRFVSNLTGTWITAEQATDPAYWGRQVRDTVRFREGLTTLLATPHRLLEVGPGRTLCAFAEAHGLRANAAAVVNSLRRPREQRPDDEQLLAALGQLWLAGQPVDFAALYSPGRPRRLSMPTYPFERQRYWASRGGHAQAPVLPGRLADLADWLHMPSWRQLPSPAALAELPLPQGRWLLLGDDDGLSQALLQRLHEAGADAILAVPGDGFARLDKQRVRFDPASEADHERLFDLLAAEGGLPSHVLHLGAVGEAGRRSERCFWSPTCTVRAAGRRAAAGETVELLFVSDGAQAVLPGDMVCAEKAQLAGPVLVAPHEYPALRCRQVDLPVGAAEQAAPWLLTEALAPAPPVPGLALAWRGGQRWQRGFEPARLPPAGGRPARLPDGAVVLVTGGLGGIGQVLALGLAAAVPGLRLGLLGRTALPASAAWAGWLADHPQDDRISQRIRAVLALRAAGAEVELLVADVQDGAALARALDQLRQRFGPVQAVLHAAGLPGGGIIALKTLAAAQAVLAPKVQGTRLLDALLANDPVEAFVLCSSINATLGSAGQVDYTAANAFLDAFALERQARRGGLTVAIAWDTWREAGMALDTSLPAALAEGRRQALRDGIGNAEGTQLLRRALAGRLPQLVVSTRPLAARLQPPPAAPVVDTSGALAGAVAPPSAHARPAVSSAYRAPSTDTERAIVLAWQAALAIDGIGVDDDFFDLGGHSLMAIQLVARLRSELGVPLPIERFLELPTVAQLAGHVEALAWTQGTPTAVADDARDEYAL